MARFRTVAEPTVEDAVSLLRDPAYQTPRGTSSAVPHGFTEVSGDRVLAELRARGATRADAMTLAASALDRVGGLDRSYWLQSQGHAAGRGRRRQRVYAFLVPVEP